MGVHWSFFFRSDFFDALDLLDLDLDLDLLHSLFSLKKNSKPPPRASSREREKTPPRHLLLPPTALARAHRTSRP